jgi:hypothetical protein
VPPLAQNEARFEKIYALFFQNEPRFEQKAAPGLSVALFFLSV